MTSSVPKQYLALHGETMLLRSIRTLLNAPPVDGVVVALAANDASFQSLPDDIKNRVVTTVGGSTRADSVAAGVQRVAEIAGAQTWALVHDAARPLLSARDLNNLITAVTQSDAVGGLLAITVHDTVKRANGQNAYVVETVDRQMLWQAQTPQMFRAQALLSALEQASSAGVAITDEASALEYLGEQPILVQANDPNFKITRDGDLKLASAWLSAQ